MKLSIIIPMYNVEKYIERCLSSCLNQGNVTNNDYEIIIVNDGAKDNSLQIAEGFTIGHSNVTIVSQENAGLSAARNKGLSLAKGEYVWFVDSDDWISNDAVATIIQQIDNSCPDVIKIAFAHTQYNDSKILDIRNKEIPTGEYSGCDILNNHKWGPPAPFFIYKTAFLNEHGLKFYEGILHEDNEFTPRMLYYAQKVVVINNVLYYYMLGNPNSITNVVKPKRIYDLMKGFLSLNDFSIQIVKDTRTKKTFNSFMSSIVNTAIYLSAMMPPNDIDKVIKELDNNKTAIKRNMLKSGKPRYMGQGILISILPMYLYMKIHHILISLLK